MKVCGWSTHPALVNLVIMEFTNRDNVVFENRRPKVTSTKDFLSSSITRHVTTIGAIVIVIKGFLNLLESQTLVENGIYPDTIEGIPDYTIRLRLMSDASMSILRQLRSKR